jgi:hypothetical protein
MMFTITSNSTTTNGQGWIALRSIPVGTPILDGTAEIRIPISELNNEAFVEVWMSRHSKSDQNSIRALHGRNVCEKLFMNGSALLDLKTDVYGTHHTGELGIFPQCARLNHSCRPNAIRATDDSGIMSVIAQRDIQIGEEITISYLQDNFLDDKTTWTSEFWCGQKRSVITTTKTVAQVWLLV